MQVDKYEQNFSTTKEKQTPKPAAECILSFLQLQPHYWKKLNFISDKSQMKKIKKQDSLPSLVLIVIRMIQRY